MHDELVKTKDAILNAALRHIPFEGWTMKAMEMGARDAGLAPDTVLRTFPDGINEAIDHYADMIDRWMLIELEKIDLHSMRVRDRLATCIRTRIMGFAEHREAIRRMLSYLTLPGNLPLMTRLAWRSCSLMWYLSGDRSADWNHYSKRGLLISVYGSTVMYWLTDEGDGEGDFPETWAFLDRRIDDVIRTFGLPRRLKKIVSGISEPYRPVLGPRRREFANSQRN